MKGNRNRVFSLLIVVSLVFSLVTSSITCFADVGKPDKHRNDAEKRLTYKEGELLIKFKDGTGSQKMTSFASENGLKHKKSFDSLNVGLYSAKGGKSTNKIMKSLLDNEEIEYVQPNYLYYPAAVSPVTPDDEYFDELWGLEAIDARKAWGITQGEEDIVVAVIDTGIDVSHPELSGRMWENPGEIAGNGIDDDNNGYVDDIYGWDFYGDGMGNGDNSVFDDEFDDEHGTHVAGIIAAEANTEGVIGVAPNVKIMSLKFLGFDGYGSTAGAIEAIEYAKAMGADIINASWGGSPEGDPNDTLLREAIEASGLLFVSSAGNEGRNIDVAPVYPAAYGSSNILTVAAVGSSDILASFSNYGVESVDVGAPGVSIYSTVPEIAEGTAAVIVADAVYGEQIFAAGFGIEDFEYQADAEDLFDNALQSLNIADGNSILLVDDDSDNGGNFDVFNYYNLVLSGIGRTYTLKEVNSGSSDGPDSAYMNNYDAVIWFTGRAYGTDTVTTLTSTDQSNLEVYLDQGGKLLLFGEDALYGIEDSSFVSDYLNVEVTLPDYGRNWIAEGISETSFEGKSYWIEYNKYRDHIIPLQDTPAKAVVKYSGGFYAYMSGTSMAAPHVSGIAALLLSKNPDLTPAELKDAIMENGTSLPSLDGKTYTGKMVNAFNALKEIAPGKPTDLRASKIGANITLTWEGREAGDFKEYIVERRIGSGSYSELIRTSSKTCTDNGIDTDEKYSYRVKAEDDQGNISGYSNVIVGNAGKSTGSTGSTGGGGGGGGGGPAAPTPPNPAIDTKIQTALKNAKAGADIEIDMIKINDTESVSMKTETIENIGKSGKSLTLKGLNDGIEIEIPSSALMTEEVKKVLSDSTAKLSINVKELMGEDSKDFTSDTSSGIYRIGDRVFQFTAELKTDKETLNINKFNNSLKITIKLSTEEIGSIDTNKLGVYHYNEEKKTWEYAGGVYNPQDGTITFDTGHFSKFAVMRTESTYNDIAGHWAKAEIQLMSSKHIIQADASKKFGPDVNITRAEIVKMLVNVLRYDPEKDVELVTPKTAVFKDVGIDNPDFSYIETAAKYGITKGNADGTFGPDDTVTREQLTTMIIRAMGIEKDSDMSVLPFDDKDRIPDWAADSIIAAYERGLVLGIGGNEFGIGSTATRAQAVVIIKRVMEEFGLIKLPEKLTGKLVINEIEGEHLELETEDGIYVLQHDANNKYLAKTLKNMIGKEVEVQGYVQKVMSIYQRGKIFKVISVKVK